MSVITTPGQRSTLDWRVRLDTGDPRDGAPPPRRAARLPHICFVAQFAWPVFSRDPNVGVIGGAEVQQSILARALARAGYRVSMITLDFGQPQRVAIDGVMVHKAHRPEAGVPVLRFIHPRLTTLWRTLREVDADVYYQRCAAADTAIVAAFCRYFGRRSIFAGASDVDFLPGRQQIRYFRDRWLFARGLALVDRVVVQNEQQRHSCLVHYGRESVLIPSCYELPPGASPGRGDCVLWAGNIRDYKRPQLFLDLARQLPRQHFVMIGGAGGNGARDLHYFEHIRRTAAALPNVEFTGFLPLSRVEPYFDRARVVVNTSRYEGMPNTFLQAWARGVPTLALVDVGARLRGEPLYRIVDNVADAAAEIARLTSDAQYWRRASARSLEYFEQTHSVARVLAHYDRLLAELVQQCGDKR